MSNEPRAASGFADYSAGLQRTVGSDLILAARDFVRGIHSSSGESLGSLNLARQKENIVEWSRSLGLLFEASEILLSLRRGGQEHDWIPQGDRILKITRDGVFGLSPGIELALVDASEDARRFHLWEATPLEYLERLYFHNQLVQDFNRLEGVFIQADGDPSNITSQPRIDIVPVTEQEIDEWFDARGFRKITKSGYYREDDNLAVFDAHDKNVVRAGDTLIPFDVIPCRPSGGYMKFIADTLAQGHAVIAVRTTSPLN